MGFETSTLRKLGWARKSMDILVDVDGVVADYLTHFLKVASHVLQKDFAGTLVDEWDISKALKITKAEEDAVYHYVAQPGFARALLPIPGAVEAVKQLHAEGHTITFVTSPIRSSPTWDFDRRMWLYDHFGENLIDDIVYARRKHRVIGDVLIDDRCKNIRSWARAHPNGLALLFAPRAKDPRPQSDNISTVADWGAVLNILARAGKE